MSDGYLPPPRNSLPERLGYLLREADQGYWPDEESGGGFDLREILRMLRRQVWLILGVTVLVIGGVVFFVSRQEQKYGARALIRLSDTFSGLTEGKGETNQSVGKATDPMQSEIMILEGRTVLGQTIDRLGLRVLDASTGEPATYLKVLEVSVPPLASRRIPLVFGAKEVSVGSGKDRVSAAYGAPVAIAGLRFEVPRRPHVSEATLRVTPHEKAMKYITGSLKLESKKGTNSIEVSFTAHDPATALNVVNTIVRIYEATQAKYARQEATRRRKFFEEQLQKTDSLLTLAQARLGAFRSRQQAYTSKDRFIIELEDLVSLETKQQELEANRGMYTALLEEIDSDGEDGDPSRLLSMSGGIAQDPVVSELNARLTQYRTELDSLTTGRWARASSHPSVQRLDTLIASTKKQMIDAARGHVSSVDAQIRGLDRIRAQTAGQMSHFARAEVEEVRLVADFEELLNTAEELRANDEAARLEEAVATRVEIIEPADRALPLRKNLVLPLLISVVAGLIFGSGAAFAREKFDDSVNRQDDIESLVMAPNLAVIPEMGVSKPVALLSAADRDSDGVGLMGAGIEAYRSLRTNLTFARSATPLKTLVVTSATPREGKTVTAVNLAIVYAWQGFRVLLVDCDFRRPNLNRHFGSNGDGRVDLPVVLKESRDPRSAIRFSGIDGIDLLPVHASSPNAAELLGGPAMRNLLRDLSAEYDLLILDSPPLLAASDAAVLGTMADGVLLVVRAGFVDRPAIQRAIRQLNHVGARVVGAVLNDPEGRVPRYDGRYGYDYAYADQGPVNR